MEQKYIHVDSENRSGINITMGNIGGSDISKENNNITIITESEKKESPVKVYGNEVKIASPVKMGNMNTFLFVSGEPLLAFGSGCIYSI